MTKMILQESYGLCPYMASMQREAKRNARIRALQKADEETEEMDIREERIIRKATERARNRQGKPTKTRWIGLAKEAERIMQTSDPTAREAVINYLEMARNGAAGLGKREKERAWIRTEKVRYA